MSDLAWLGSFLAEAAHAPEPLMRTIASARRQDLTAAAAALELVPNPAVRVFGYAALGRRNPEQCEEFLIRAAKCAELLPEVKSRVSVITALIDALPPSVAQNSLAWLMPMIENLPSDLKTRYLRLLDRRIKGGKAVPAAMSHDPLPDIRIVPDMLASRLASVHLRTSARRSSGPIRIRPLGTGEGRGRIRLAEIASSVGINPHSFVLDARPTTTAMPILLETVKELPGTDMEQLTAAVPPIIRPERVVSTGFADERGEPSHRAVQPGELHFYFVEVGARVEGAAESGHSLPQYLEEASIIDVVMSMNNDGLTIEGPCTGRLRVERSGAVVVAERAAMVKANESLLRRRMFFAFRAPPNARPCSMRCSFYCSGMLFPSRHISVPVGMDRPPSVAVD